MNLPNLTNKRVFLLAGGPSLNQIDLSTLSNEVTLGINMAYRHNPTLNYANDRRFWHTVYKREDWINYKNPKVFANFENVAKCPGIIPFPVTEEQLVPTFGNPIYPGNNSGFGGIQLAISLGSRELYLLGYDMQVDQEKIHWHEEYPGQCNTIGYRTKKLKEFKKCIEDFSKLWFAAGIDIQLCTPSALKCFEYTPLQDVLVG